MSVVSEEAAPGKLAPELVEARQEASRKQVEARDAQAELASITERMNALSKSIELEQKQFETSRQKAENSQATERTLYEALQDLLEQSAGKRYLDNDVIEICPLASSRRSTRFVAYIILEET